MPLYKSGTPEGQRVVSVKLDGTEVLDCPDRLLIVKANTDEGWLDIYESEMRDGKRHAKCTEWERDPKTGKLHRDILRKRLTGKVEVTLRDE